MEACDQELLKIKADAINRLSEFLKLVLSEASTIIKGAEEFDLIGLINELMNSTQEGHSFREAMNERRLS